MFFLTKAILATPLQFLIWLGTPFNWKPESTLKNYSEKDLREKYYAHRNNFYAERFFASIILIILCIFLGMMAWISSGYVLLLIPIFVLIIFGVDCLTCFGRYVYTQKTEESFVRNNLPVPVNHWKDTSLKSLLKQREDDIQEFETNKKNRM